MRPGQAKNELPPKQKAKEQLASVTKQAMATARRVGEMELIVYNLSRENEILKDALQLIHEKLDAVISLQNAGTALTEDNINEAVVKLKELSLKEKIDDLLKEGVIEPSTEVSAKSLIVSRELSKEGVVENPRLQFLVGRLVEELQVKFLGKKTGDLIKGEDNKLDIEIMEIYDMVEQSLGKIDENQELPLEDGTEESQGE